MLLKTPEFDLIDLVEKDRRSVEGLLAKCNLLTHDLPHFLEDFIGIKKGQQLVGVVGSEVIGSYALLRSMAVLQEFRGNGLGSNLILEIERKLRDMGVLRVVLLTTTAEVFFSGQGFNKMNREDVPKEIKSTSQFSAVCPASAIVMSKDI